MHRLARSFSKVAPLLVSAAAAYVLPSLVATQQTAGKEAPSSAAPTQKAASAAAEKTNPSGTFFFQQGKKDAPAVSMDALRTELTEAQKEALKKDGLSGNIRYDMEALVLRLQEEITSELGRIDGSAGGFKTDVWRRPEGGGGRSRVLQGGNVFEKAGVGVSIVHGKLPAAAVAQMRARGKEVLSGPGPFPFYATGISLVIHPHNPHAPTTHANFRYFEVIGKDAETGEERKMWWFGGGSDLTPSYLYPEDCLHFHSTQKEACDKHDPTFYPRFKAWADDYFLLPHRGQRRGVGGIFFDDLDAIGTGAGGAEGSSGKEGAQAQAQTPYHVLPFMRDAGESFLKAYVPLLLKRKDSAFTEEEKQWQQLRRGAYAEFNLVNDRGTKFGLATPGSRTESILMSLPLTARWEYMARPAEGSREEALLRALERPVDWVGLGKEHPELQAAAKALQAEAAAERQRFLQGQKGGQS